MAEILKNFGKWYQIRISEIYFFKNLKIQPKFAKNGWKWLKFRKFSKNDIRFGFSVQIHLLDGHFEIWGSFFKNLKIQPKFSKNGWKWLKFWNFSKTDIRFGFSVQIHLLDGHLNAWSSFLKNSQKFSHFLQKSPKKAISGHFQIWSCWFLDSAPFLAWK